MALRDVTADINRDIVAEEKVTGASIPAEVNHGALNLAARSVSERVGPQTKTPFPKKIKADRGSSNVRMQRETE